MTRVRKPSGRPPFGAPRPGRTYGRIVGTREPQQIMLVLCEGSQTEPTYFRALKAAYHVRRVHIEVIAGGKARTAPVQLVGDADRERGERQLGQRDQVWCVFDTEKDRVETILHHVAAKAAKSHIHLAVSNPALEYWYLLHYERTNAHFADGGKVTGALRAYIPRYDKSMDVFRCLGERTEQAIANAMWLREQEEHHWTLIPNPSTGVDRLVQAILQLAEGGRSDTG